MKPDAWDRKSLSPQDSDGKKDWSVADRKDWVHNYVRRASEAYDRRVDPFKTK